MVAIYFLIIVDEYGKGFQALETTGNLESRPCSPTKHVLFSHQKPCAYTQPRAVEFGPNDLLTQKIQ